MAEPTFAERLGRESERWVAEGLITAEQAAALRGRYEGAAAVREEPRGRAASALAVVGAAAVGFGVIGFLAANWEAMSHGLRLALITAAVGGAYAAGYELRDRTGRLPRVGEALYLLGVLLFGAALFLVGQMYNVEAHDPLALLVWSAAAAVVALAVRSPAVAVAALLIFTAWVGFEAGTALEGSGEDATALAVLAVLYGGALYGLGTVALERIRAAWLTETRLAVAGRRLGLLIAAAGLFVFTFSEASDELGSAGRSLDGWLQAALLLVAAVALASAVALALGARRSGRGEAAVFAVAVALLLIGVFAGGSGDLYALLFNLVFAALALGAILSGYLNDEPWLVNLGVALVAIDLVARYFDVFWSALPRSLGLILAGILVLAIAWGLERQRQRLLARMDA
ncbi:MAG TPA: DUF2157 domain-containing protein [Gaiellaceae bacterium]|nr:DUF2157 domain-containing protein [Gaiellaceae bacterium]